MYGGAGVEYSPEAEKKIELLYSPGIRQVADLHGQAHLSLSHDPDLKGAPSGFHGAGARCAGERRGGIPLSAAGNHEYDAGASTRPGYYDVDIDTETGSIIGLS